MENQVQGPIIPETEQQLQLFLFKVDDLRKDLDKEITGLSKAALDGITFSTSGLEQARTYYQNALRELGFFIYTHQELLK